MDCIPFGERYDTSPAPESLRHDESRRLFEACLANKAFRILELRKVELVDHGTDIINILDAIIVDCADGTFPSKNKVGIKPRERLALIYYPSDHIPYHVWAIRRGFPDTLHQNHMPQGYPASLCLYFESWPTVERTWTPEKHLQRVLWWLRETAGSIYS